MSPGTTERAYWRAHVGVDEDPLATLTFTRAADRDEDPADVGADAIRAYRDVLGLPEHWTVHVEISMLAGPTEPRDAPAHR